jgi:hypothetical protein
MKPRMSALLLCLLSLGYTQTGLGQPPRVPMGIYARPSLDSTVVDTQRSTGNTSLTRACPNPGPNGTIDDAAVIKYLTTLLDNPAVSGLSPEITWCILNPGNPGPDPAHPAKGAYQWKPLDDVFTAVDEWNSKHSDRVPKTIQLIILPGFNSPDWVFSDITAHSCGLYQGMSLCIGSCDGLFKQSLSPFNPPPKPPQQCGYTSLFWKVESAPVEQIPLPLPWNPTYKSDWQGFLTALNDHIQGEPSSEAFVSIEMAGPTASTTEMILPSAGDQKPALKDTGGFLVLPKAELGSGETTIPKLEVAKAWNILIGSTSEYPLNSDQAIIDEWNTVIDGYGKIFSDVTLSLTTTTDALPTFPHFTDPGVLVPAPGFEADCAKTDASPAMACAAVTQVLAHFTDPLVGGNNAKATQENGMTAARDDADLGANAIRWLAWITSEDATQGPGNPPPIVGRLGLPGDVPPVLGGLQFSHSFSSTKTKKTGSLKADDIQATGCPTYPKPLCKGPDGTKASFSPSEGLANVLSISFFAGTKVAPSFCAYTARYGCGSASVTDTGNFKYSNAPMNFVQIYDDDILYAEGSSADAQATQMELNQASQSLLSIAEPRPAPF